MPSANRLRPRYRSLLLSLGVAWAQSAQTATVSTPSPTAREFAVDPEPFVLSPFTVNTAKDVGFVATSSLAGGRLASDLKDTPAAYSVLTREFIDALNLVDLADASKWTVNNAAAPDDGRNVAFGSANGQVVIRGIQNSGAYRDFFPAPDNFDSYNLDRFDFARGPSAVLFGNSSFGGTANTVTRSAAFSNFAHTRITYGSWQSVRSTLDLNRVLVADKLALRLNALLQDKDGWRTSQFDRRKGVTLGGTYRPFKNTEVRLQSELGRSELNDPVTTIEDGLSGWDGKTTFATQLAAIPANAAAAGITRIGAANATGTYWVWNPISNGAEIYNAASQARSTAANDASTVQIGGIAIVGPAISAVGLPITEVVGLPGNRYDLAVSGSKFRVPDRAFAPVYNNAPIHRRKVANHSAFATQKLGDLYLEAAGNFSQMDRENNYTDVRGLKRTLIDINQTLPGGVANPHYLEPYNEGTPQFQLTTERRWNVRASAAYVVKDTKFGDFTVNSYAGQSWLDSKVNYRTYQLKADPDHSRWANATNGIRHRYYWSERDHPIKEEGTIAYIDPVDRVKKNAPVGYVTENTSTTAPSNQASDLKYLLGSVKGSFLKNRLIFLGAARRDILKQTVRNQRQQGDHPTNWNGDDVLMKPQPPADYFALTYVPKNANGVATGPAQLALTRPRVGNSDAGIPLAQYANDRFRDDYSGLPINIAVNSITVGAVVQVFPWLSLNANRSQSFNPGVARQRLDGSLLPTQVSIGKEVGARFTLWRDRVSAAITYYEGEETGQGVDPGQNGIPIPASMNTIIAANAVGDFDPLGRNRRGLADNVANPFDIRDRQNKGWELDLTANLTANWRLLLNGALPKAYQANAYPDHLAYLAKNDSVIRQVLADTGVLIDGANVASVDLSVPLANRSPDVAAVANAWNILQTAKANIPTAKQKILRLTEATANVFTDYEFRRGALKGFKIGVGANYRGRQAIGYRGGDTVVNPAAPTTAIDDPRTSAYDVVTSDPYTTATVLFGYSFKLKNRQRVTLEFLVDNAADFQKAIYYNTSQRPTGGVVTQPGRVATPTQFFYVNPRSYTLSATLKF